MFPVEIKTVYVTKLGEKLNVFGARGSKLISKSLILQITGIFPSWKLIMPQHTLQLLCNSSLRRSDSEAVLQKKESHSFCIILFFPLCLPFNYFCSIKAELLKAKSELDCGKQTNQLKYSFHICCWNCFNIYHKKRIMFCIWIVPHLVHAILHPNFRKILVTFISVLPKCSVVLVWLQIFLFRTIFYTLLMQNLA